MVISVSKLFSVRTSVTQPSEQSSVQQPILTRIRVINACSSKSLTSQKDGDTIPTHVGFQKTNTILYLCFGQI